MQEQVFFFLSFEFGYASEKRDNNILAGLVWPSPLGLSKKQQLGNFKWDREERRISS
jgi:hypothetical protein